MTTIKREPSAPGEPGGVTPRQSPDDDDGAEVVNTDPDPVENILVWAEGVSMLRGRRGGAT